MNKEYIERELAIKQLEFMLNLVKACPDEGLMKEAIVTARQDGISTIKILPAADVAPVVHAHWKTREEYNDYLWVECSNCGFRVENYKAVKTGMSSTDIVGNKWNACPACCARMDGGNK